MEATLKSPLLSDPEEFNDAKIGLKVMNEISPNKIIVEHLHINYFRDKFEPLQYIININQDIILLSLDIISRRHYSNLDIILLSFSTIYDKGLWYSL